MVNLAILFVAVVCLIGSASKAGADDSTTIAEVRAAFTALDAAFAEQDAGAISRMMTADHVAVTSYYGGPTTVAELIQSLPDLVLAKEIPVAEMEVALLGPDTALITFIANIEGTFRGEPLPPRGFVTAIMVRRDGRWLERFYQLTALSP